VFVVGDYSYFFGDAGQMSQTLRTIMHILGPAKRINISLTAEF
jgi:hypothetical protein